MRSSELAALAGVTVRTLRHYHQIGVLDEPERSANGYRDYDARHLARVVRITRLTGLGVALADLPAVLDDPETAGALLDRLDRETTAEIDRLTARRAQIADLRRDGLAPDVPPELGFYVSALAAAGVDPALSRYEREYLALYTHLAGQAGTTALAAMYARLAELLPTGTDLNDRFLALGPGSPEDAVTCLVDDLVAAYGPVVTGLADLDDVELPPAGAALLEQFPGLTLNDPQQRVIRMMSDRLEELLTRPGGAS